MSCPDVKETINEVELEPSKTLGDDNDITEENNQASSEQTGVDFLMAIAGIFDSGTSNTSENVKTVVSDFIENQRVFAVVIK